MGEVKIFKNLFILLVHRLGQTKNTYIHRYIARSTIEETIYFSRADSASDNSKVAVVNSSTPSDELSPVMVQTKEDIADDFVAHLLEKELLLYNRNQNLSTTISRTIHSVAAESRQILNREPINTLSLSSSSTSHIQELNTVSENISAAESASVPSKRKRPPTRYIAPIDKPI